MDQFINMDVLDAQQPLIVEGQDETATAGMSSAEMFRQ
jgi:hypothetical protein